MRPVNFRMFQLPEVYFNYLRYIAVLIIIQTAQPVWASKVTIAAYACSKAHLERFLFLRENNGNGAPCDVVYFKPSESDIFSIPWSAENEAQYCSRKYNEFQSKLNTELGWECSELRDDRALRDIPYVELPPTDVVPFYPQAPSSNDDVIRRINGKGEVVLKHADGTTVTIGDGSKSVTFPDGTGTSYLDSQAPVLYPPPTPISAKHTSWLESVSEGMLLNIKKLVDFDDNSVNAYVRTERSNNPYEKISKRTQVIRKLLD